MLLSFVAAGLSVAHAEPPKGWLLAGSHPESYRIELDNTAYKGSTSALLESTANRTKGFGTMMQMFTPTDYLGKRVQLSAWVKAEDVDRWAGLWMRVDGPGGKVLAFDNMQDRPLEGTKDWREVSIVLDVPKTAQRIAFGVLLVETGRVWLDDLGFDVVGEAVPTTGKGHGTNDEPTNLSFEE